MTFDTDTEPQVEFDEDNNEWVWTSAALLTGVVAFTRIRGEIELHQSVMNSTFVNLTRDMYSGNLLIQDWQLSVASELRDAHMGNAIFAAGGRANMTPEALLRVEQTLAKEFGYLSEFANQVESGLISEAQAVARIQQYSNAIEQSYWNEWTAGTVAPPEWNSLPQLTRVPGDGSTDCHGNCKCWLNYTTDGIMWELTALENCDTCVDMAAGSPYRP